jgi:hypothetical protein
MFPFHFSFRLAFAFALRNLADAADPTVLMLIKKRISPLRLALKLDGKTIKTYRGNFKYNGIYYSLSLTDPFATSAFTARDEGEYRLNDVYLCISLTEPWEKDHNRCHKLVAAVFSNPPL